MMIHYPAFKVAAARVAPVSAPATAWKYFVSRSIVRRADRRRI
jgi:hypothetical protein